MLKKEKNKLGVLSPFRDDTKVAVDFNPRRCITNNLSIVNLQPLVLKNKFSTLPQLSKDHSKE
ncbi:hypothetical protein BVY03_00340 [bacterium K02(2017)]|nr:hypothetical protein BVY03_00340 [bacterium K02(2017)]